MYFNPRTHRGVRLNVFMDKLSFGKFQSTHPSWGATMYVDSISINEGISIHAPIVGCDSSRAKGYAQRIVFQSTHPSWGATMSMSGIKGSQADFNPRTHRGVRQKRQDRWRRQNRFQSTHPSWGATVFTHHKLSWKIFKSTHPSWGATLILLRVYHQRCYFNPRTHRGVRQRRKGNI